MSERVINLFISRLQINPSPIHSLPLLSQETSFFFIDLPKRFHSKNQLQISNFKQRESHATSTTQLYPHPSSNQIVEKKLSLSGSCSVLRISFTLKTLSHSPFTQ